MTLANSLFNGVDTFIAWLNTSLRQTMASYCSLQTADSPTVLVGHDGALMSIIKVRGVKALIGAEEFNRMQQGLQFALQTAMKRKGHVIQVLFSYNKDQVKEKIHEILEPAYETSRVIGLSLEDLFLERENFLAKYCAYEEVYLALWTRPSAMTNEQRKRALKEKRASAKDRKLPVFVNTQNVMAAIADIREQHDSFVRAMSNDLSGLGIVGNILPVHEALHAVRHSIDPNFTDANWRPLLPGDKITIKEPHNITGDIGDILWPSLARQLLPRDAENMDIRTCKIGDLIYGSVFIDLFPKEIQQFVSLFSRTLQTQIPWRISFLIESGGLDSVRLRAALSSVLSFASSDNRLFNDSVNLLKLY